MTRSLPIYIIQHPHLMFLGATKARAELEHSKGGPLPDVNLCFPLPEEFGNETGCLRLPESSESLFSMPTAFFDPLEVLKIAAEYAGFRLEVTNPASADAEGIVHFDLVPVVPPAVFGDPTSGLKALPPAQDDLFDFLKFFERDREKREFLLLPVPRSKKEEDS